MATVGACGSLLILLLCRRRNRSDGTVGDGCRQRLEEQQQQQRSSSRRRRRRSSSTPGAPPTLRRFVLVSSSVELCLYFRVSFRSLLPAWGLVFGPFRFLLVFAPFRFLLWRPNQYLQSLIVVELRSFFPAGKSRRLFRVRRADSEQRSSLSLDRFGWR